MKIWDTFILNDELDVLECRLRELENTPVWRHVIVEAAVDHRGRPKPFYYADSKERFSAWKDRIVHVAVSEAGLPSYAQNSDPWSREHAQREHARTGLYRADPHDVVLHGDADEIPSAEAVKAVGEGFLGALEQQLLLYAVDWLHPVGWRGTIAARSGNVGSFAGLRDQRNRLPHRPGSGWHLSWLGGVEAQRRKLGVHCHLEMTPQVEHDIATGRFYREGVHSDGVKLVPVDVNGSWPKWVAERRCPPSWFRPREEAT